MVRLHAVGQERRTRRPAPIRLVLAAGSQGVVDERVAALVRSGAESGRHREVAILSGRAVESAPQDPHGPGHASAAQRSGQAA